MSVEVTVENGIMTITLNRPEASNALNAATAEVIVESIDRANADPDVRVIVLTGSGDKVFSAGMDLKAFAAGENMRVVGEAIQRVRTCRKPVIAAINGTAMAGGFELMLCCDLMVAADHAKFGIPEVKRGLVAAGGGTRLPRRIPLQVALEMGLTGEPISAQRALELGLVNRVVPAADVVATAHQLAGLITANGPLAVQATKQLMLDEIGPDNADDVAKATAHVFSSEDAREGATAFAQKRAPEWKGR